MSLSAKQILESPDLYPLQIDGNNLLFVRMSRRGYQQSIFTLPERIVQDGDRVWAVPFGEVMALVERQEQKLAPPTFIFQIAHCGSTLMSRALDQRGANLVIREPFTLRQFAAMPIGEKQESKDNRRRVLQVLWYLYSRRYNDNEPVLIKANVPVNYMLSEILDFVPETTAVLLYCGFEDYLLSALKSEKRRTWATRVVREMTPAIKAVRGFRDIDLESLRPVRAAALLWLSQLVCFRGALENNIDTNSQRLRTLNCAELFERPAETLYAAKTHLGFDMTKADITRVTASNLFKRHAKNPEKLFSEEQRLEELNRLRIRYRDRIDDTVFWCDKAGFDVDAMVAGRLSNNSLI